MLALLLLEDKSKTRDRWTLQLFPLSSASLFSSGPLARIAADTQSIKASENPGPKSSATVL